MLLLLILLLLFKDKYIFIYDLKKNFISYYYILKIFIKPLKFSFLNFFYNKMEENYKNVKKNTNFTYILNSFYKNFNNNKIEKKEKKKKIFLKINIIIIKNKKYIIMNIIIINHKII